MNIDVIVDTLNQKGKVIAISTDTVYGLVCNAYDKDAVEKIYKIKNREKKKPLSIFIKDKSELKKFIDDSSLDDKIKNIINKYWPGALTIIFKTKTSEFYHLTNNTDTIGIRVPNDERLLNILNKIDFPLAQTSCNLSGEKEYSSIEEIKRKMGDKIDLIVDDTGKSDNKSSTVISFINDSIEILRTGDIIINE